MVLVGIEDALREVESELAEMAKRDPIISLLATTPVSGSSSPLPSFRSSTRRSAFETRTPLEPTLFSCPPSSYKTWSAWAGEFSNPEGRAKTDLRC
jgi:hypothetical protein